MLPNMTSTQECATKPLDGITALVTDDDPAARRLLAIVLDHNGAKTTVVSSVHEAMQEIKSTQYDLLVSDIGMPGEDGYVLARWLRDQPNRPRATLALTAYGCSEDRRNAIAAGFDGYAVKPMDAPRLVAKIAALLAEHP